MDAPIRNGRSIVYYTQPSSSVGGKYGIPCSGIDARKHRLVLTPTNGRDTSLSKHMHEIGKVPTQMVSLNSITRPNKYVSPPSTSLGMWPPMCCH